MATIEKLDKITRLEEGKATAITETTKRTFTLRDIQEAKDLDEEVIEEAEFTEVVGDIPRSGKRSRAALPNPEEANSPVSPPDGDEGNWGDGD
jgi:hypothetical protein